MVHFFGQLLLIWTEERVRVTLDENPAKGQSWVSQKTQRMLLPRAKSFNFWGISKANSKYFFPLCAQEEYTVGLPTWLPQADLHLRRESEPEGSRNFLVCKPKALVSSDQAAPEGKGQSQASTSVSLGCTSTPCGLLRLFIFSAAYSQSPAVSVPPNTDAAAQLETPH